MRSTRDRFHAAISGAATPTVAAGVVTAMHLANCKELLDEVKELFLAGKLNNYSLDELKAEYTA